MIEKHFTNDYISWLNDCEVTRYISTLRGGINKESAYRNIKEQLNKEHIQFFAIMAIETLITGNVTHVGNAKLRQVEKDQAIISLMLGNPKAKSRGIGSKVVRAIHNIARDKGDILKIVAVIDTRNIASIKLFTKNGYKEERQLQTSNEIEFAYYLN